MDARASQTSGFAPLSQPAPRTRRVPVDPGWRIEIGDGLGFAEDVAAWRDLVSRTIEPDVFLEPDVLLAALRQLPEGRRVRLLTVWQGERMQGLMPVLPSVLPGALRELQPWRPPHTGRGGVLLDRNWAGPVVERILDHLGSGFLPHAGLLIPGAAAAGPLQAALQDLASRTGRRLERRQMPAAPEPIRDISLEDARRALQTRGALRIERATDPRAVRDGLEEFLALDAASRQALGEVAMIQETGVAGMIRTAARALAQTRRCRVGTLRLDGRAIAAAVIIKGQGRSWLWQAAGDPAFEDHLPAVQLAVAMARNPAGTSLVWTEGCGLPAHPALARLQPESSADVFVAARPRPAIAVQAVRIGETIGRQVKRMADRSARRLAGRAA